MSRYTQQGVIRETITNCYRITWTIGREGWGSTGVLLQGFLKDESQVGSQGLGA